MSTFLKTLEALKIPYREAHKALLGTESNGEFEDKTSEALLDEYNKMLEHVHNPIVRWIENFKNSYLDGNIPEYFDEKIFRDNYKYILIIFDITPEGNISFNSNNITEYNTCFAHAIFSFIKKINNSINNRDIEYEKTILTNDEFNKYIDLYQSHLEPEGVYEYFNRKIEKRTGRQKIIEDFLNDNTRTIDIQKTYALFIILNYICQQKKDPELKDPEFDSTLDGKKNFYSDWCTQITRKLQNEQDALRNNYAERIPGRLGGNGKKTAKKNKPQRKYKKGNKSAKKIIKSKRNKK